MASQPLKFNNLNDLVSYLGKLENRITMLENENRELREQVEGMAGENQSLVTFIRETIPKTSLFSKSFMARAFTVWGHYFVAQLLISVVLTIAVILFSLLVFGSIPMPGQLPLSSGM